MAVDAAGVEAGCPGVDAGGVVAGAASVGVGWVWAIRAMGWARAKTATAISNKDRRRCCFCISRVVFCQKERGLTMGVR